MMLELTWNCKFFDELTKEELYDMLALRTEVFVVEQNCPYQELDGIDKQSHHLFAVLESDIIACLRIVPAGISYKEVSIGRVVVKANARKKRVGDMLMNRGIEKVAELYGGTPIRIGAQTYLQTAYEKWGFEKVSEPYLEDGIEHVTMLHKTT